MSRSKRTVPPRQSPKKIKARDSFSNILARIGFGTPSLLEATEYPINRLTRDYALMNSLYRNHWIVRRIVDTVPEDMCKNWITLKTQVAPDLNKRFDLTVKRTATQKKIVDALKWGRLYGGAAAILMIDGHEDILDEPLDYDTVMPGSYCGLLVRDRWSGISPGPTLVTDPRDVEFGLPDYYQVVNSDGSVAQVHHSRVLRFIGRDVPEWEKQAEVLWGVSEIEHVYDELKKRDNTSWNIANLVFRANLLTKQTDQLDEIMALGDADVQSQIYHAMQAQNWLMNNFGIYMLGKGEQLDTKSYAFSGIAQVMEVFMYDIAGAAEMPFTKLFGRSPAGLNSTGESDLQTYYDSIGQKQETYLSPALDKLLPVIALSEWGYVPEDLDYGYNQIGTLSNQDKADLADKGSEAIGKAYDRGLISARTALKELRQQSDVTGYFTNITDEDIERAEDQPERMDESTPQSMMGDSDFSLRQPMNLRAADGEWREEDHPRRDDGKFGSGGKSSAETTGRATERNDIISSTGVNRFKVRGFANKQKLNNHWKNGRTHQEEYPGWTMEQYEKRSVELVEKPVGGNIVGHKDKDGQVIRYDKNTNDFVKGHPNKGVRTMFKPVDGEAYYKKQRELDIEHGGEG